MKPKYLKNTIAVRMDPLQHHTDNRGIELGPPGYKAGV
jgi:hypothetical protein